VELSEQAKLTYLQEKIKEARFMGRLGWIIFILGGAVVGIGFLSYEKTGELSILGFGIFFVCNRFGHKHLLWASKG